MLISVVLHGDTLDLTLGRRTLREFILKILQTFQHTFSRRRST